jgi:catechol 2,3-dioxygenase-like lactoylglutathione lyase family enzyme
MPNRIDHVVIAVRDLEQASNDFRELGFTVIPGGEHAHRASHNALIAFQDGSYIEVIAFHDVGDRSGDDWWDQLQKGEGFVDFAVLTDDLDAVAERLRKGGQEFTGPSNGGRTRTDGQEIAWKVARPAPTESVRLPFVIEDVSPIELRVPSGDAAIHANGALGLHGIYGLVGSASRASAAYTRLLGAAPVCEAGPIRFNLGPHWIELIQATGHGSEASKVLTERSAGPLEIVIRTSGTEETLPLERTHGARIRLHA